MRNFVIKSLEMIIWIVAALIAIGGVIMGLMSLGYDPLTGILLIIGGPLYAILFSGMFFVMIGTYENTKRTAEACESMASK